jgi:hypothetical protein
MIQRTRVTKPIHNEIVTNPKPNKKVKLLNEFVGGNKLTNKLVNENNIVINMPVPVVKKKRKKKPKISDEAKKNFQQTLSEFRNGNFIEPLDLPDISTIKTSDDLNNFTNILRLTMGKPLIPIKGKPNLPIMDGEAKPLAPPPSRGSSSMDTSKPPAIEPASYTGTIGNAYANIVPTNATQTQLSPPPPPPPSEQQQIMKQLDKNNWVDSITLYILNSKDTNTYDNLIKNILPLTIDNTTAYETIKKRLNQLFLTTLSPLQLEQKAKYYMDLYIRFRSIPEIPPLFFKLLDAITFIISNDEANQEIPNTDKRRIFDFYTENSDYFDTIAQNDTTNYINYYVNTKKAYQDKDKELYALKIRHVLSYFTNDIEEITADDSSNTQTEKLQITFEEINTVVNETPEEAIKVENINENPALFYTTYYPDPDNVYKEVNGHPFVTELKNIIRLVSKVSPNNKLKAELIILFKTEYDKLKNPVLEPPQEPTKLYQFIRDYYTDGIFQDKKNMPPIKQSILDYADEFILIKNNEETNKKWNDFKKLYKTSPSRVLRPTLAKEFYLDFIKFYETPTEATGTTEPNAEPSPSIKPDEELTNDEFYNKYYPEGVFNGVDSLALKEELVKRIKLDNAKLGKGTTVASSLDTLSELFKRIQLMV